MTFKLTFLIFPLALLCVGFFIFYHLQEWIIFFPDQTEFKDCDPVKRRSGHIIEEIVDDEKVRYYKFSHEKAKLNLIHFHGNAGRACDRLYIYDNLKKFPMNIILAEYPGFSEKKKRPQEKHILKNAMALIEQIKSNPKENLPIIFYGESIGTTVTTYLAAKHPPIGLILQSPFPSLLAIAKHHHPYLPVGLLLRNTFKAHQWASDIKSPVLIIQGGRDQIVPEKFAKEQSQNFQNLKKYVRLEKYEHNNLAITNSEMWPYLDDFFEELLKSLSHE